MLRCLGCFDKPVVKEAANGQAASGQHATTKATPQQLTQAANAGADAHALVEQQLQAATAATVTTAHGDHLDSGSGSFYSIGNQSAFSEFGSCRNSFSSSVASASGLAPSLSLKHHVHTSASAQPDHAAPTPATAAVVSSNVLVAEGGALGGTGLPPCTSQQAQEDNQDTSDLELLLKDADALWKRFPCQAYQAVLQYCEQQGTTPGTLAASLPAPTDASSYTLHRLMTMAASLQLGVSTVQDHTGWHLVRNDALKMWYRHTKGSTVHNFKGECILECPMEHVLALAREFDLVKTWNHYITESAILKEHSPSDLLCLAVLWMPWPLSNIDLLVEASGCDMLDSNQAFVIAMQTPKELMPGISLPETNNKKNGKLRLMPGSCMRFQPLLPAKPGGPPRVLATVQSAVDAGIKHVPEWIITFVLKVFGPFIYTQALSLLSKSFSHESTPYSVRLRTRPAMYGLVRARAAAYLEKMKREKLEQAQGQEQGALGEAQQQQEQQQQEGGQCHGQVHTPEPASPC